MIRLKVLISIFLCLFFSKGYPFEIIFPADNATVSSSDIHIVAKFDDPTGVYVKNEQSTFSGVLIPSKDRDGEKFYMLMSVLKLKDGLNSFTVIQGKKQKKISVTKVNTPIVMEDWTQGLSSFHTDIKKTKICTSCHKFENITDCANCHKDRLMGKWIHSPVREGKCFDCHDKANYYRVKEPAIDVCLSCHKNLKNHLERSIHIHGPVAGGYCTICHSPHKNNVQTHLRKTIQELCNLCHKSEMLGYSYHSRDYIKNHPVSNKIVKKTGKNLNCVSCHNSHAENSQKLLILNKFDESEFCLNCHEGEKVDNLVRKLRDLGDKR